MLKISSNMNLGINIEDIQKEAYLTILMNGNTLCFPASGWSMSPALRDGDLLTIKYADIKNIKIGDIIIYKSRGAPGIVAHRLIKKCMGCDKPYIITKGDANLNFSYDPYVYETDILGKAVSRQRNGRIERLDTCFANIYGYVFAKLLLYCPYLLLFLKKILKTVLKLCKVFDKKQ